jgi:UDP-N-acetylmuramoyl-L-alanyl-D-glutamate--2,6-diaminopimelate ligase
MATSRIVTQLKAHAAAWRHGRPAQGIQVILVAGYDGAAETIAYLAEILKNNGDRVGVIAQDYIEIAGERAAGSDQAQPIEDAQRLNATLAQMKRARCKYALIEVAGRPPAHGFAGIPLVMLVVRRIADERLDQVTNTAAIVQIKRLARHNTGQVVLPRDDAGFSDVREVTSAELTISYGTDQSADSRITKVRLHPKGSAISLNIDHQTDLDVTTRHAGKQSIYSLAAAVTAAYGLHVPLDVIEESTEKVPVLPANCEYLAVDRPYKLVLDSSVTPQGIAEVLETLKHFAKNRLIAVVSSNLAQPSAWRSVVGEAVAGIADRIIVTDGDWNETESPQAVRAQILEGTARAGSEAATEEVEDRQAGIEKAISIARRGDTIVLCSVTTRPYRQLGANRQEWSDRNVINELT